MTKADRQALYLERMGIERWTRRNPPPAEASPAVEAAEPAGIAPPQPAPSEQVPAAVDWPALQAEVAACRACGLCEGRTQTVFGVGDRNASLMVVGEAPGAEEDKQGEPFVGRAGKLLDQMLRALELPREQVFIANILKCRPPNNRDPQPAEVAACEPFLQRQLHGVAPKLILAVGRIAAQNLLKVDTPLGKLRGQLHHYGPEQVPVVVTYHPAYLLRSPKEKARAWEDLKRARALLRSA